MEDNKEEGVFVQAGRGGHKGQPLDREETDVGFRQMVVYYGKGKLCVRMCCLIYVVLFYYYVCGGKVLDRDLRITIQTVLEPVLVD